MNDKKKISLELLAPAGSAVTGIAAVDHGADAVYIGAPRFSARANAGNSFDDIARLVDYAHFFNVKVYLALNTLLTDSEIPEAVAIAEEAWKIGVDGLIIQDTGLLLQNLPPITLIASTQMNNVTPEKVKFLEDIGFSRVILARELSLDDIRKIREKTSVELECFVHGALCVCYSGQCYLSHAVSKRSGNRGVCAQPCRLSYSLIDGNGREVISKKHFLSLKDFNLSSCLKDLAGAGVTSFKIEGRYKDVAYVKNVTAAYSQALDRLIKENPIYRRQSSGNVRFEFEPDLFRTFNRGYTTYFFHGDRKAENQAAIDSPKSSGDFIGHIEKIEKKGFRIKGKQLTNGDGLCFLTEKDGLKGIRVEKVQNGIVIPNDMKWLSEGLAIFRNHDHDFLKQLERTSSKRTVGVDFVFSQDSEKITLTATDEDGNEAVSCLPVIFELAKQPEKMKEKISDQLKSTGNTMFSVKSLHISSKKTGFIPVSLLNQIRRGVIAELELKRKKNYVLQEKNKKADFLPVYPEKNLDYRANVLNSSARLFYEKHEANITEDAMETGIDPHGRALMVTRYCIRRELGACLKNSGKKLELVPPLVLSDGRRNLELEFDCNACRMLVFLKNKTS